jgi:hypothetical protein
VLSRLGETSSCSWFGEIGKKWTVRVNRDTKGKATVADSGELYGIYKDKHASNDTSDLVQ